MKNLIDKEELLDILQTLIQNKSQYPIETEEAVARYIQQVLIDNGIEAELSWVAPGRPNVIAKLVGIKSGPTLLYNGHLDVVPAGAGWCVEPFKGSIKEGKMYGRGAADMKSGVASMIYAAIVLKRMGNPFSGELILCFNVDEERENLGMKKFLTEELNVDFAVISEPTNLDICIGHRGCGRYRIKTNGTPGHVSVVKKPDNAISKMVKIMNALDELCISINNRVHPIIGSASLIVSQIKGGTAPNIVPHLCEIEVDRRILPDEVKHDVYNEIDNCIKNVAEQHSFSYQFENYQYLAASYIDESHLFVKELSETILKIRKKEAKVRVFEASCEAAFLSVEKGIPTIICGPGSIQQAHVVDEYVEIKEMEDAALMFMELALRILQ